MKRIFALLLALLLLCTLVSCGGKDGDENEETDLTIVTEHKSVMGEGNYQDCFEYEIVHGDEVAIVGFTSLYDLHDVVIPAEIEGCPVVEIADGAFYQCSQITGITIPATVTEIGNMAFAGCLQLKKVTFAATGAQLVSVGEYAFAKCVALETIALPASLTALGEGAFFGCTKLVSVLLPQGVTAIADMTFMGCTELVAVTSEASIVSVGDYAFCGCAKLLQFMPAAIADLRTIGEYAFSGCVAITPMESSDTLTVAPTAFLH